MALTLPKILAYISAERETRNDAVRLITKAQHHDNTRTTMKSNGCVDHAIVLLTSDQHNANREDFLHICIWTDLKKRFNGHITDRLRVQLTLPKPTDVNEEKVK
jgi:hypothetical protein